MTRGRTSSGRARRLVTNQQGQQGALPPNEPGERTIFLGKRLHKKKNIMKKKNQQKKKKLGEKSGLRI